MKAVQIIFTLSSLFILQTQTKSLLSESTSRNVLQSSTSKYPVVEGIGYKEFYSADFNDNLGIGFMFQADLYLGYTSDLFILDATSDQVIFNPTVFLEVGSHAYVEFALIFANFYLHFDFNGFRYTPVDFALVKEIYTTNYCYGLNWWTEALSIAVNTEFDIYECMYGYLGYIFQDKDYGGLADCQWKSYYPLESVLDISIASLLGMDIEKSGSWVDYVCYNSQTNYG